MNDYNLVLNRMLILEYGTTASVVVLLFLSIQYSTSGSNLTLRGNFIRYIARCIFLYSSLGLNY